jgi:putative endonuclease
MDNKFYVYILQSIALRTFYVGQTQDVEKRLSEHNDDEARYTKVGQPWVIVWQQEVASRSEAMRLEQKVKRRGAKRFLLDSNVEV